MQSWVVEVDGLTVVIDTGVGNDRERPHLPGLGQSEHRLPRRAAASRLRPRRRRHRHQHPLAHRPRRLEHPAGGRLVGADLPERPLSDAEADYRYFSPDGAASGDGFDIVFADSVLPVGGSDRAVRRRPPTQRFAVAAAGPGAYPGIVGGVAGRRHARGVRRRPHPLPDPDREARRSVRVRRQRRRGHGHPQTDLHRGVAAAGGRHTRRTIRAAAGPRSWRAGDRFDGRRLARSWSRYERPRAWPQCG